MAFTKIKNSDFNDTGALNMPNRPSETISAQNIKKMFDAPAKEVITPAFNQLIDDLEDTTAAASIGAVAPVGARGNTVQAILNGVYGAISTAVVDVNEIREEIEDLSEEVDGFSDAIETLEGKAHTHDNKSLLDTYTQTESNLADAVSKKHSHENKDLLDTYTQTNSDLAGAVLNAHYHDNKALLDTYNISNSLLAETVQDAHTHSNKSVLNKLDEDYTTSYIGLTYDGSPISDVVSVNNKHGVVSLSASDVGALPDTTTLADLSGDSTHRTVTDTEKSTWNGKSTVSVTQVQTTGTKIATVTVDGTGTDIYAPEGGAGSGDMKKSDYDSDTTVKNAGGIKTYVTSQISTAMATLATVATSGSYNDLSNKPTIPQGDMLASVYDSSSAVANAGGIDRYVSSQISAQITSALTASY